MSYLNALRLTFCGQFQAAVSTVNNDPTHYNNATFKTPEYQERPAGWWNPRGDANWRMIGCQITSATLSTGEPTAAADPVLTYSIADSDLTVAAKLVDLDPAQQTVSEIWGLDIRLADRAGKTLLQAKFEPAAFMDIWTRWPTGSGDGSASAVYQSVLTNLQWGDIASSTFLTQLREKRRGCDVAPLEVGQYRLVHGAGRPIAAARRPARPDIHKCSRFEFGLEQRFAGAVGKANVQAPDF